MTSKDLKEKINIVFSYNVGVMMHYGIKTGINARQWTRIISGTEVMKNEFYRRKD